MGRASGGGGGVYCGTDVGRFIRSMTGGGGAVGGGQQLRP